MFLFIVYAKIIQLNETNYRQTIQSYPYILVEFYSKECSVCKSIQPEYQKASNLIKEPNIKLAQIDVKQNPQIAKAFKINQLPTFYFYRLASKEEYNGPRDSIGISKWMLKNSRPLIYEFETQQDLNDFLQERIAMVYFDKMHEEVNENVIQEMRRIGKKYSKIYMVHARQPQMRYDMVIPEDISLVLYPRHKDPMKFEGYISEYQIIQKQGLSFPMIFSATDAEIELFNSQQWPGLIFIDDNDKLIDKIAMDYEKKLRIIRLDMQDLGGILYFQYQLLKQEMEPKIYYLVDRQQELVWSGRSQQLEEQLYEYFDKDQL